MKVRVLPAGDAALLVEVAGTGQSAVDEVLALTAALQEAARQDAVLNGVLIGVDDLVPAARTVLVLGSAGIDLAALELQIADIADRTVVDTAVAAAPADDVLIPVRYDGPDLDDVARLTGLDRAEVIARHTGTRWRAAFIGFAPGFAYLAGDGHGLDVPRRAESRTNVPTGSVALAGGFSAVYPNASPGGWQLIGSSDVPLWDVHRDPPSLIGPGQWVRFAAVTSPTEPGSADESPDVTTTVDDAPGTQADARSARADVTSEQTESTAASLEVLRTGPLCLFQDLGRSGLAYVGVGRSGAADRSSYLAANRLLGNDDNAVVLESVLGGLSLRATGDLQVAVTGAALAITVDGESVQPAPTIWLTTGQVIKLGTPKVGLRSYLSVRGGFDVPAVLGSRSSDTLSGLGPKQLRQGDLLRVCSGAQSAKTVAAPKEVHMSDPTPGLTTPGVTTPGLTTPGLTTRGLTTLRAMAGPRDDWFDSAAALAVGEWVVSSHSNRVGIRLDRPDWQSGSGAHTLRRKDSRELPSEGLALGSVQVPPSGQPVLFLADHPVTGGYPVVAVVLRSDVDLAAQLRPGERVRFEL